MTKLIIAFCFMPSFCMAQTYAEFITKARVHFSKKEFSEAAHNYQLAFVALKNKGHAKDRYYAAIAYSSISEKDSAFINLFKIANKTNYLNCDSLTNQSGFENLRGDKRWEELKSIFCYRDERLVSFYDSLNERDQKQRLKIDSIGKNYGYGSEQMKANWKLIHYTDSLNLKTVDSLYALYGWPNKKIVGKKACVTFYIIIQHSDLAVQEKYLPAMKEAVKSGNAELKNLAYLEDRILMKKGLPQLYGSQSKIDNATGIQRLYKLQDKVNINKLRESVDLPPLTKEEIDTAE